MCDFGGLKYCEDNLLSVAPIMVWNIFRLEYNQTTGHTERHMTMIPLEDRVNMSFLLHDDILEQPHIEPQYLLYAFITHLGVGSNADFGHYVAYIKFRGAWVEFNDNEVSAVVDEETFYRRQAQAYMAFYFQEDYLPLLINGDTL
jgi:ubiquitin C-terminal hydrolase